MGQLQTVEAMQKALNTLRPHRIRDVVKVRVARFFGGGYVILNSLDDMSAAYSLGINDGVSWDLDSAERGIEVFQYDYTIEKLPRDDELCRWSKMGIAGETDDAGNFETIADLISKTDHATCDNLLLKYDIEGYEWAVFADLPVECARRC